jgi:hypothetical protein
VKKSDLKCIIREIFKEVAYQDIKVREPYIKGDNSSRWDPSLRKIKTWNLDNLKYLMGRSAAIIWNLRRRNNPEDTEKLKREWELYRMYDAEMKRRLLYINRPVTPVTAVKEDHGLGYSHNVSFNDYSKERDPLNDPILTGRMNEGKYKFEEFAWLANPGTGFDRPYDVYHGTILMGVIISKPDGYVVWSAIGPDGMGVNIQQSPKNKFRTKEDAAKILHLTWSSLRHKTGSK